MLSNEPDTEEFLNMPVEDPPEPPTAPTYTKREVLATVLQRTGKFPTVIEVVRYTWTKELAAVVGYPTCIRLRRKYQHTTRTHRGVESVGVPEADFKAFVEALMKVKI